MKKLYLLHYQHKRNVAEPIRSTKAYANAAQHLDFAPINTAMRANQFVRTPHDRGKHR